MEPRTRKLTPGPDFGNFSACSAAVVSSRCQFPLADACCRPLQCLGRSSRQHGAEKSLVKIWDGSCRASFRRLRWKGLPGAGPKLKRGCTRPSAIASTSLLSSTSPYSQTGLRSTSPSPPRHLGACDPSLRPPSASFLAASWGHHLLQSLSRLQV